MILGRRHVRRDPRGLWTFRQEEDSLAEDSQAEDSLVEDK
jgi:hypothetical protein